jgi:uncharacterized NAD-dependent epimerase/dehydratase family protein
VAYDPTRRILIYAQGAFGRGRSKTADGVIRYGRTPIVGVVDGTQSASTAGEVLGCGADIPIFPSLEAALPLRPEALLIGIAPPGGKLPAEWRVAIAKALSAGLDVISGLHEILGADPELAALAARHGRTIWDVRLPRETYPIASGRAASVPAQTVLTVGTDCALGKMTVLLEMQPRLERTGRRVAFLATGQTGIMISGSGVPLDRVIGDFMAGAAEELVLESAPGHDLLLIEGQGSLLHPGFSGVTLALLHGAAPSHMILCHEPRRTHVRDSTVRIPPLREVVQLYESMASFVRRSSVIGIALNTTGLDAAAAERACRDAATETGLPATDPLRFDCAPLVAAVNDARPSTAGGQPAEGGRIARRGP